MSRKIKYEKELIKDFLLNQENKNIKYEIKDKITNISYKNNKEDIDIFYGVITLQQAKRAYKRINDLLEEIRNQIPIIVFNKKENFTKKIYVEFDPQDKLFMDLQYKLKEVMENNNLKYLECYVEEYFNKLENGRESKIINFNMHQDFILTYKIKTAFIANQNEINEIIRSQEKKDILPFYIERLKRGNEDIFYTNFFEFCLRKDELLTIEEVYDCKKSKNQVMNTLKENKTMYFYNNDLLYGCFMDITNGIKPLINLIETPEESKEILEKINFNNK